MHSRQEGRIFHAFWLLVKAKKWLKKVAAAFLTKTAAEDFTVLFFRLKQSDCQTKADLVGYCFEWASVRLPQGVEVIGRPSIKARASYFKV